MIRQLKDADQALVLDYLYKEVNFNIFTIGDIETFGMETEFQRIYGEFDDENQLISVFLRYRENAVYTSYMHRFNEAYLDIFKSDPFKFMSGKSELLELIEPYLEGYKKQKTYFCRASSISDDIKPNLLISKLSTEEDAGLLYDLLKLIEEFAYFESSREAFIKQKQDSIKMGMSLFIKEDGKIISNVSTTAETTKNAMVVAVATHPEHRQKGYASMLIKELMYEYIVLKKKELCLFYDNPKAGKIYIKLGFKPIGKWSMYRKIK
ncbi:MAG: GNAT family N-acetyltransferase [Acholeplasmataceae bacterium]